MKLLKTLINLEKSKNVLKKKNLILLKKKMIQVIFVFLNSLK